MGQIFDALKEILGTILVFFHDLFSFLDLGGAAGMAIIGLTILINLLVFPLTLKQTRATRAFQEIQPKVRKLQAEFKDDPQELQKRLMEVQREAGATPGGCLLPMLVQMPIWFALFQLLRAPLDYIDNDSGFAEAIQSGATFLGMHLPVAPSGAMESGVMAALPYLIIIAVMVATQYVQQWHATYGQVKPNQQGAAAQQAITKILPLFIGFISWNLPAGLIIYWSTANLFRLGQQALIFKIDGRPSTPQEEEEVEKTPKTTGEKKQQQGAANRRRRRRRS
ncbi:MAG TPA: YidC/Oxa1 family membrane protein insertase [Acidimicrobiia bacterium]|jgi:YidC/Oxa1 family membrane protein insertase|nr:YidC/Oxa1 family membrane protein insertase [Acidimicrobiia bacterium]